MSAQAEERRPRLKAGPENLFDWQPGNGGRYYIAVTDTGGGKLLTWLKRQDVGGVSFLFIDVTTECIGAGYFMEKMGMDNEYDAKAILDFAIEMGLTKRYY